MRTNLRYLILLIILYLCRSKPDEKNNELTLLRKYYGHVDSAFFFSIGDNIKMRQALALELRGWQGLKLHENQLISNYWQELPHPSKNLPPKPNNQDNSGDQESSISLSQICKGYFFQKPKLFIITNPTQQSPTIRSNNWKSQQCSPETIFILEGGQQANKTSSLKQLFVASGYVAHPMMKNISIYVRARSLNTINSQIKTNMAKGSQQRAKFFTKQEYLDSLYSSLFPGSPMEPQQIQFPSAIYSYHMDNSLLSIPEAIDASTYLHSKARPIVVFNFRGAKDSIYLGSESFKIQDLSVDGFLFKHIQISREGTKYNIYVLKNDVTQQVLIRSQSGAKIKQSLYAARKETKDQGCFIQQRVKVIIRQNQHPNNVPLPANYHGESQGRIGGHIKFKSGPTDKKVEPAETSQQAKPQEAGGSEQQTSQVEPQVTQQVKPQVTQQAEPQVPQQVKPETMEDNVPPQQQNIQVESGAEQQQQIEQENDKSQSDDGQTKQIIDKTSDNQQHQEKVGRQEQSESTKDEDLKTLSEKIIDHFNSQIDELKERQIYYLIIIAALAILCLSIFIRKSGKSSKKTQKHEIPTQEEDVFGQSSQRMSKTNE